MATVGLRDAIGRVDIFSTLDQGALDALVESGATMTYGPGQQLVEQGARGGGFQLLLTGSATAVVNGDVRRTLAVGDYFGEMSLFDDAPRSATIVAGDDGAKTFAISPLSFGTLLDTYPRTARGIISMLARRLRDAESATAAGS